MNNEKYNSLTYRQTVDYHTNMRSALFEIVEAEYASLGLSFNEITFDEAKEAETWKSMHKPGRAAEWNWTDMYQSYQSRGSARRFDMAISKSNKLVGLAYGMLERNRLILKVHAMEANPQAKSLANRMLEITLYAAGVYAKFNQTPEIWLCNPVSPAHVRLYSGQGYEPHYDRFDRCTHLIKKVK